MSGKKTSGAGAHAYAPLEQDYVLACGIQATMTMPDMLKFADGSFDIPNSAAADIMELIYGGNFSIEPMQQLNFDRNKLRGLYALASIVYTEPKVVLDADDAVDGAVHYRTLAWGDVLAAHAFFRYGPPRALAPTESAQPDVSAEADSPATPGE